MALLSELKTFDKSDLSESETTIRHLGGNSKTEKRNEEESTINEEKIFMWKFILST